MIWYTNDPNAHIRTFCKRWSFIWRCFFPMSILKDLRIICNVHWKTPVLESLFNNFASLNGLKLYWKETLTQQVFSCEYCEIFRKSFFIEHLRWLRLNNIQKITLIFKVDHISLLSPAKNLYSFPLFYGPVFERHTGISCYESEKVPNMEFLCSVFRENICSNISFRVPSQRSLLRVDVKNS